MRKHFLAFAATAAVSSLLLTGCVDAVEPEPTGSSTPKPSASSPAPTTSPTPTPEPTTGSATPPLPAATVTPPPGEENTPGAGDNPGSSEDISTEWKTVTVDGWVTVSIPSNWDQEEKTGGEAPEQGDVIVDQDGNKQVQLAWVERDRTFDPPACIVASEIDRATNISRSKELPNAYPGERLARTTQIRQLPIWQGEENGEHQYEIKYSLEVHLFEMDRAEQNPECGPFPGMYPDEGGVLTVGIVADPWDGLYFNTEEGAKKYTQSAEYKTIERIIESARITL